MAKPASGTALDTGHALFGNWTHVWAFLEGTGTTIEDSKGSNDGTLRSSGLWTTNADGAIVRETDGTQRTVALGSAVTLGGSDADFTIVFRVKQTADNDNGMVLGPNNSNDDYLWLRGANYLRYNTTGTSFNFTDLTLFTTIATYILVRDREAGVTDHLLLYKDGSLVHEENAAGWESITFDTLGNGWTLANDLGLEGDLEFVGVMDGYAMNSTEVTNLSAALYGIFTGGGGGLSIPVAMNLYRQYRS